MTGADESHWWTAGGARTAGQLEQAEQGPARHGPVQAVEPGAVAGDPGPRQVLVEDAGVGGARRVEDGLLPQRYPGLGCGQDRAHRAPGLFVGVGTDSDLGEGR